MVKEVDEKETEKKSRQCLNGTSTPLFVFTGQLWCLNVDNQISAEHDGGWIWVFPKCMRNVRQPLSLLSAAGLRGRTRPCVIDTRRAESTRRLSKRVELF